MRKWLKSKGLMLALALALAAGAPLGALQNPVEVSAKAVKQGKKLENGKYYYYVKGKKIKNQWKTISKKRYYFKKDGSAAVGWNKIGNKAYYFDAKGVMEKNKTVHKVKLDKNGEAKLSARAKVMIKAQSVVEKKTKATQSKEQKLKICYKYMVQCGYLGKRPDSKAGWEVRFADDMLRTRKGNCYSFAAAFGMLARACGYNARIVTGTASLENGRKVDHAWVEIGGKVYDPQQENSFKKMNRSVDLYNKTYESITEITYKVKKKI